jgi:hypothetical protein
MPSATYACYCTAALIIVPLITLGSALNCKFRAHQIAYCVLTVIAEVLLSFMLLIALIDANGFKVVRVEQTKGAGNGPRQHQTTEQETHP